MNVSVLGCGRWGSFLAWYADKIGHKTTSFGPDDEVFKNLKETGKNEYVKYPTSIAITCDLKSAVDSADILIIAISAQVLREFLPKVLSSCKKAKDKKIILCMKGIEESSGKRLTEVAIECGVAKENVAVWVGPGHIQDFVNGVPNCMVMDSYSSALTKYLADTFSSNLIRFYYGTDIIGTEIGAATKNVLGLLAGMLDGLGYGALKGALMARGAHEVAVFIKALGGSEWSAYGLCHLGDYEATLFSPHSNNRLWGEMYIKGQASSKLAEGVATARAVQKIAVAKGIDMPITNAVDSLVREHRDPREILDELFSRVVKTEF